MKASEISLVLPTKLYYKNFLSEFRVLVLSAAHGSRMDCALQFIRATGCAMVYSPAQGWWRLPARQLATLHPHRRRAAAGGRGPVVCCAHTRYFKMYLAASEGLVSIDNALTKASSRSHLSPNSAMSKGLPPGEPGGLPLDGVEAGDCGGWPSVKEPPESSGNLARSVAASAIVT